MCKRSVKAMFTGEVKEGKSGIYIYDVLEYQDRVHGHCSLTPPRSDERLKVTMISRTRERPPEKGRGGVGREMRRMVSEDGR